MGVRFERVNGDDELIAAPVNVTSKLPGVAPGENVDINVDFKAPQEPGQYLTFFRLIHGDNIEFGDKVWIDLKVKEGKPAKIDVIPQKDELMLKSEMMLNKFDDEENLNKSIEAKSVHSENGFEIEGNDKDGEQVDDVVMKDEPAEKIQVGQPPSDPSALIQNIKIDESMPDAKQEASSLVDKDKEEVADGGASIIDNGELQKINYMTLMETEKYNPEFKHNLMNLMNMGFMDFKKNVTLLQKHFNNLELVCSKIIEEWMQKNTIWHLETY